MLVYRIFAYFSDKETRKEVHDTALQTFKNLPKSTRPKEIAVMGFQGEKHTFGLRITYVSNYPFDLFKWIPEKYEKELSGFVYYMEWKS